VTIPKAIGRGVTDTLTGRDRKGAGRAGAVLVGVTAAGVGGVVELFQRGPGNRPASPPIDEPALAGTATGGATR
jgi:hypothetical protein